MKKILSIILACAMLLTMVPVSFAGEYAYEVTAGATSFEAKAGEEISVPIYVVPKSGDETIQMVQINLPLVAGLELASWSNGVLTASDAVSVDESINTVVIFQDNAFTASASNPLVTLVYKANAAGTYTIASEATELYNADYDSLEGEYGECSVELSFKEESTPVEPPVTSDEDYVVKAGATAYTAKVGEEISVPVYVAPKAGDTAIQMIQINLPLVAGLELASWSNGVLTASDAVSVDESINTVVIFQDNEFTASASNPLVTLVYKATAAGTYTIKSDATELYNADYDPLEGTYGEAEFTITATADETPIAPTLTGITANITEFEVPYGEDALAAVKAAITTVTATYSDNTTAPVTDYTVALEGAALAVVEYQGYKAEIALTYEAAPVVLTGITANITAFEVPYGEDALTAVKAAITTVTATYSDNTTAPVTEYTVALDGADKAVVEYNGFKAEIALTYEAAPIVPPAGDDDYTVMVGATAYTAKVGEEISVPVYVAPKAGDTAIQMIQINLPLVAGLELASWSNGALTASDAVSVDESINTVVIFQDNEFTASASNPLVTLVYKATAAGTYTIKSDATELYNADYDPLEGTYGEVEFTITATSDEEPPAGPTLTGITVNPTSIEVPYGMDAYEYVTSANGITGVTAVYSDGTTAPVTGWEVEISGDGSKAIVKYEGQEAEIALTDGEAPVTDVEIIVGVTEITVPYGTAEADVEAYVKAQVGEVKVKDSKGVERVVEATVAYDAANGVATVSYESLPTVQIPVKVITLVSYKLVEVEEPIEIPYDTANAGEYVAGKLSVKGILSDESEIDVADFTVTIEGEVATVKVGDTEVGTVAVKMGEAPVAAIVGIEIVPADAIVIPYGVEEIAEYIKSKIVVNTIDENNEKAATEAYELVADDGVATVSYGEFTDTVDYSLETATLTASVSSIEIPYTVAEADYAAYIAGRVTVAVDYSADTRDETITITADMIELDNGIALITALDTEVPVEVPYTVQPAPEYVAEVVANAYGLEGKVLVKVTGVADGKVVVINGIYAKYFGNGKFAAVVDAEYDIVLEEVAAMPAADIFGMLHPEGVTAWDALVTNDEALEKDVEVFADDIQNYVLADFDGNGKIEAIDALNINKISLNNTEGTLPSWAE